MTFLARDKFGDPVEFRRRGATVEYRYTNGGNGGRWKEPTWEMDVFTESEKAAYRAAQHSDPLHSPRRKGAHMSDDHYIQKFQCGHVHSQCRCASREKREIVVPKNCPDCSTVVPVSCDTPRPRSALDQQVAGAKEGVLGRMFGFRISAVEETRNQTAVDALLTTHRRQVLQEVKDFIDKNAWTRQPLQQWLDTQLLRDTKENV